MDSVVEGVGLTTAEVELYPVGLLQPPLQDVTVIVEVVRVVLVTVPLVSVTGQTVVVV